MCRGASARTRKEAVAGRAWPGGGPGDGGPPPGGSIREAYTAGRRSYRARTVAKKGATWAWVGVWGGEVGGEFFFGGTGRLHRDLSVWVGGGNCRPRGRARALLALSAPLSPSPLLFLTSSAGRKALCMSSAARAAAAATSSASPAPKTATHAPQTASACARSASVGGSRARRSTTPARRRWAGEAVSVSTGVAARAATAAGMAAGRKVAYQSAPGPASTRARRAFTCGRRAVEAGKGMGMDGAGRGCVREEGGVIGGRSLSLSLSPRLASPPNGVGVCVSPHCKALSGHHCLAEGRGR